MDIWKHGTYVDLWSVPHLLTGVALGMGAYWIGFSFIEATVYVLLLLVAWEGYEFVIGILENAENVVLDIVIGMLGFAGAAVWHYGMGKPFSLELFAVVTTVLVAFAVWGFGDFLRKGYR